LNCLNGVRPVAAHDRSPALPVRSLHSPCSECPKYLTRFSFCFTCRSYAVHAVFHEVILFMFGIALTFCTCAQCGILILMI
jgi:hypothetical protein